MSDIIIGSDIFFVVFYCFAEPIVREYVIVIVSIVCIMTIRVRMRVCICVGAID